MIVTVTTDDGEIVSLEVSEDFKLEDFKALCELELKLDNTTHQLAYLFGGVPLMDGSKLLGGYGISDGDIILVQQIPKIQRPAAGRPTPQAPGPSSSAASGGQRSVIPGMPGDPATIRDKLMSNPHEMALLKERNPKLAESVMSGDLEKFVKVITEQQLAHLAREKDLDDLMHADPMNPDVQERIAERIRQENVNENMEKAMEWSPENFAQVHMLYINVIVNGHAIKAFVDSGAQMTIMSQACAEKCSIMRLVDKRWAGIAKGVGTQRIIGRVHLFKVQVKNLHLSCSFSILEDQQMDMVLGLDMLKRHQCCIDLRRNVLTIGDSTELSFLSEGELPHYARLNQPISDEDKELQATLHESATDDAKKKKIQGDGAGTSRKDGAGAAGSSRASETIRDSPMPSSATVHSFSPDDIAKLVSNGLSREQACAALERSNGNVAAALLSLFAQQMTKRP